MPRNGYSATFGKRMYFWQTHVLLATAWKRPLKPTIRSYRFYACVAVLATLMIIGCKVGPDYQSPAISAPATYQYQSHILFQGAPADLEAWWKHFNDPTLSHLVHVATVQNLTLREAGQRVLEARYRRNVSVGNLFPQNQTIDGDFSQSRLSSETANFFTFPGVFDANVKPQNWTIGANLVWELDFWGRYRRAIESADASLDAALAAEDEARVILVAEIASTYVEIRTLERRINLARENIEIQKRNVGLAERKQANGLESGIDVAQAWSVVHQTEAGIPMLEIDRRKANHRLSVLLGGFPQDLSATLGWTAQIPIADRVLAFDVPADLLRRRPDIRKAERELASQSAKIGVAESEFYPHINLRGNIGFAAEDFSNLFVSNSRAALISPQFSWNILNYGRIKNNVSAERVVFDQLATRYYSTVLNAAREAEDAQVSFVYGFDRLQHLNEAVEATRHALSQSTKRYQAGLSDFANIYVLQADLIKQQDQQAAAEGAISTSLIDLFRALGGGWAMRHPALAPCASDAVIAQMPVNRLQK